MEQSSSLALLCGDDNDDSGSDSDEDDDDDGRDILATLCRRFVMSAMLTKCVTAS